MTTGRENDTRRDLRALVLILSVSAVVAYGYYVSVDRPYVVPRLDLHNRIIAGTAPGPYRYRVLVPFGTEYVTRALSVFVPFHTSFLLAYAVYDLLAVFFLLAMLFRWLRIWFTTEQALVGALFVAGTMPIALQDHYFQPWSLLEAGLFSVALSAMHRRRYWLLTCIAGLAALNKETSILIPLAFLLTIDTRVLVSSRRLDDWKPVVVLGGLFLVWGGIFGGLRYGLGHISFLTRIPSLLAHNLTDRSLSRAGVNASLFLGGFWIFALAGFRSAPRFIRRVTMIVPIYLAFVAVWGVWHEVRMLMSLYPVLVPLGLSFLYLREQKSLAA